MTGEIIRKEFIYRKIIRAKKYEFFICFFILIYSSLFINAENNFNNKYAASQTKENFYLDSLKISKDTISKTDTNEILLGTQHFRKSSSDMDTIVKFYAKDSSSFNIPSKKMRLRGEAKIEYKTQKLESEVIIMHFENSNLESYGLRDSNNKIIGYPKFKDNTEEYYGEQILYNFKTNQGTIKLGETEVGDGFYYGAKIKKISEDELFIKDGCYTTCDAPHSHYYFGSPKMKVVANDRVFLDPLIVYVEDMPVFILPFGLFFPAKGGRQSGLIIPSFYFSDSRGVVLNNLGLYLALSDYYDTEIKTDLYSKGGFVLKNSTRWALKNVLSGNINLEYGQTRTDPDMDYLQNWSMSLNHDHTITPYTRLTARMQFSSQDYYRNTSWQQADYIKQTISSNASLNHTFDNGSSFFVSFSREQDIVSNEIQQTFPNITYTLPMMNPLKSLISTNSWLPNWLRDLSFNYSVSGIYYTQSTLINDTSGFIEKHRSSISHRPSISVSPKLGYFTLTPSFSISANNYFRKLNREFNQADSTLIDTYEDGFFTEYWYSFGAELTTRLFGIIRPNLFGMKALRHTFQPSVRYSITPDFSGDNFGFYGKYYNEATKNWVTYSKFESDGGGSAPRNLSQSINYSILNSFESKMFQGDTLPDLNVDMLRWSINGSYNMSADSLKFSDISMNLRSPALKIINFNADAAFTMYDQRRHWDTLSNQYTGSYYRVNQFLLDNGKGILRLTNFSIQVSTSFNSQGMSSNSSFGEEQATQTKTDSTSLGSRFKERMEYVAQKSDIFGDNTPGYTPITIPWSVNLGLNFQYNEAYIGQITRRINLNAGFSFTLTPSLTLSGNANYDLIALELITPSFSVKKDLHCWELYFQWIPTGYSQGYYLRFGIKAPQLKDLQLEKRNTPLLR